MLSSLSLALLALAPLAAPPDDLIEDLARAASTPAPVSAPALAPVPVETAPVPAPQAPPNPRQEALDTYRDTGVAPVLYLTNEVVHPWGQSVPTLTCAPLNICSIDLEAGEKVQDIAAGDPVRWQIATATSGEPATPHLIVKPTEFDLATNLLVTTQRRVYAVELRSPSRAEARKPGFRIDRSLSFYYPDDFVRHLEAREAAAEDASRATERLTLAELSTDLAGLNFDYRLSPARAKRPLRVFDDGHRTYLQLRNPGEAGDAPALLALTRDGKPIAVNFRPSPDGAWYIVDGVFPRLRLVTRSGRHDQKVTIVNRRVGEGR